MRTSLGASITVGLLFCGIAGATAQDAEADVEGEVEVEAGGDVAASASGTRVSGDFGVGGQTTLGGTTGIHGRLMITEGVGLMLTLDVGVLAQSNDTEDRSVTTIGAGLSLHLRVLGWDDGHASFVASADYVTSSDNTEIMGAPATELSTSAVGVGGGFMGEVFVEPWFSVHAETGVRFQLRFGDVDGWTFGTAADLVTSFGFTFWV